MNRIAQGLVLALLGTSVLSATVFSDLYLNYVQGLLKPFLVAAGVVLLALAAWVITADVRTALRPGGTADDPHTAGGEAGCGDHGHAPRVAWLLLLPVVSVVVVAPPALGAYTAESSEPASPVSNEADDFDDLGSGDTDGPVEMELSEFVSRAWTDTDREMAGRTIELTGFAVAGPENEEWYLARLEMACCAADAVVNRVLVTGQPAPEEDTWWTVRGTWEEPDGDLQSVRDHRFAVAEMTRVTDPPDPYE
ncbi:putative repeat protein (TIGR03943 family) [Haloactinospora alba]|uniref:Putative repeat protein (TIGR03943 family) n=1 Tax=Haloactinospora alba TaxID=405555 RepID=A0A543NJ57_9ACTN|nr:TIGR03943 family protein [Haloactinospora alba]TQN31869.1 putative repeat protein (TIGR03943 family) [Haloactinospora alba]